MTSELQFFARSRGLIVATEAAAAGGEHALRRAVRSGEVVRIRRGYYVARVLWQGLTATERHVMRAAAVRDSHGDGVVFSHATAAAILGLPNLGEWPSTVHTGARDGWRGRSQHGVLQHLLPPGTETVPVGGFWATSVADTVIAVAATAPFLHAVAIADAALHPPRGGEARCTRSELEEALDRHRGKRRHGAAVRVTGFASPLSDSPGESISRAAMSLAGIQAPELQVPFYDQRGLIGYVDFYWPGANVIGEFDGRGKYLREEYTQGLSAGEVVIAEKRREDRLRARGPAVARWGWELAVSPDALADHLLRAGVPRS